MLKQAEYKVLQVKTKEELEEELNRWAKEGYRHKDTEFYFINVFDYGFFVVLEKEIN